MPELASAEPVCFPCLGATLVGVLHLPATPSSLGLVIVVGGPQYRVGSHRQFLHLARALAEQGIAVLRFDCRGMGDSDGDFPGFEQIEPDIAAAVDFLARRLPTLTRMALWGLCDATLGICAHAARDDRVGGIVLLNPWVRSEAGESRARLRHYYLERLTQLSFLRKLLRGELDPVQSARDLWRHCVRAIAPSHAAAKEVGSATAAPLTDRMADSLEHYAGETLLIISGRDLTAREFADETRHSRRWRRIYANGRFTRRDLPAADHTFSRRIWRDEVAEHTLAWLGRWGAR